MKITAIRPYPVWVGHRNQLLVKVETDEGVVGWGESVPLPTWSDETLETALLIASSCFPSAIQWPATSSSSPGRAAKRAALP